MNASQSLVDPEAVSRFLTIVHEQAASALNGAPDPGFLQLGRVHPTGGGYITTQFEIGDVDGMARQACADASAGHNVYVEGRTVRRLNGGRGKDIDTRGVFAFVVDDDADKGKGCADIPGASLIVETSPGNRHHWLFLDKALPPADATHLGELVKAATGADADTGVITQPYRVAGTPNYPGSKKQARGRVDVTPTRILEATGALWTPEGLRKAFPPPRAEERTAERPEGQRTTGGGTFARAFIEPRLAQPVTGDLDRSDEFQSIVCDAVGFSMSPDVFEELARLHPEGCAGKYLNPDRLREEIDRSYRKAEEWQAEAYSEGAAEHAKRKQAETEAEFEADFGDAKPKQCGVPFKFYGDLDGEPLKAWIMKGVATLRETSAWIAGPGQGKSTVMTDLIFHVASGRDWRGFRSKQRVAVLYWALERGDLVLRKLRAYRREYGDEPLPIAVTTAAVDLMKREGVEHVVSAIRDLTQHFNLPVGMVVFDTYAKLIACGGGDENSAQDQNTLLGHLRLVQDATGVHIALIGHTGKDESRGARGSNAFLGDVDMLVQIEGDGVKVAKLTKANDMPEGELTSFTLETYSFGEDEDGDPITTAIVSRDMPERGAGDTAKRGKISDRHKVALSALDNAVSDFGQNLPAAMQMPAGLKFVSLDQWRNALLSRGILSRDDAHIRQSFYKLRVAMDGKRLIGVKEDMVWRAT